MDGGYRGYRGHAPVSSTPPHNNEHAQSTRKHGQSSAGQRNKHAQKATNKAKGHANKARNTCIYGVISPSHVSLAPSIHACFLPRSCKVRLFCRLSTRSTLSDRRQGHNSRRPLPWYSQNKAFSGSSAQKKPAIKRAKLGLATIKAARQA